MKEISGYLTGQFLMATPQMMDPRFDHALIYICGHDENGAMGLIINKPLPHMTLKGLLEQLQVTVDPIQLDIPIYLGGPVETTRGFVLHSDDYFHPATVELNKHISMTATLDILEAIAAGKGPKHCILALGYAGWSPGQLDHELHENGWLQLEADEELIFDIPVHHKWSEAMKRLGVDLATLHHEIGHS